MRGWRKGTRLEKGLLVDNSRERDEAEGQENNDGAADEVEKWRRSKRVERDGE